ncbi:MAG: hypothetical protein M3Q39_04475 [Actinomycetota bacterium]|nr:hypothetical protein [Actinomycetota bacterium]
MTTTGKRPPVGTGPTGRALWRSIIEGFRLEPHKRAVLAQAVQIADRIAALDTVVDAGGDGR